MSEDTPVLGFSGPYSFLSNFATCEIRDGEFVYPSVEHAYQASKSLLPSVRRLFQKGTARDAKKLGQRVELRPDWESVKLDVMLNMLRKKFSQREFGNKLLATGNGYLEETNSWGDTFWGVFGSDGENHLGLLLMQVRTELQEGKL